MKGRGRGWWDDRYKHGLASRGIRTSLVQQFHKEDMNRVPPKELYDINWGNMHTQKETIKVLKLFWWCSLNNNMEWFPFDEFFKFTEYEIIRSQMIPHLVVNELYTDKKHLMEQLRKPNTVEERKIIEEKIEDINHLDYKYRNDLEMMGLSRDGGYYDYVEEPVWDYVSTTDNPYHRDFTDDDMKVFFKYLHHEPVRRSIYDLLIEIRSARKNKVKDVLLVDKIIHTQHMHGRLITPLSDFDMDELRKEFEEEYL